MLDQGSKVKNKWLLYSYSFDNYGGKVEVLSQW